MPKLLLGFLLGVCLLVANSAQADIPKNIRGFADFNFSLDEDGHSHFSLGQYDTYITGQLTDRISYLSEVVFEYDNGWILDVERVWMKYEFTNHFSISGGKFHTALGYWNRTFHHGALLHASINRPSYLLFEDEGGVFPIHATGVLFSGKEITSARLYYDVIIANGLGASPTQDNDKYKALNAYLHTRAIDGIDAGISVYIDRISQGATVDAHTNAMGDPIPLPETVDQLILSGSLAIEKHVFSLFTEIAGVRNKGKSTGIHTWTRGFYALGSIELNAITPFIMLDYLNIKPQDIYYSPQEEKALSLGINYRPSFTTVFKLQYTHKSIANTKNQNTFAAQMAIGF
jgi:hypothetical protein